MDFNPMTQLLELCRGNLKSDRLDADALLRAAAWHGIFPWAYVRLRDRYREAFPPWAKPFYLRQLAQHYSNRRRLAELLEAAEREGIRLIPLKGPALAERCYDDPFLRQASIDLDFYCGPEEECRVDGLLTQLGYDRSLDISQDDTRSRLYHSHNGGGKVDLHLSLLAHEDDRDWRWVFSSLSRRQFEGVPCWEVAAADLLWLLDLELIQRNGHTHLKYYLDVAGLVARFSDDDWRRVGEGMLRHLFPTSLYLTLGLSREFFGAAFPDSVRRALETPFRRRLLRGYARIFPYQYPVFLERRQPQAFGLKLLLCNLHRNGWGGLALGMLKTAPEHWS